MDFISQRLGRHYKKDAEELERVQRKATRMVRVLKVQSYEEQIKRLGIFGLTNRKLRSDTVAAFKCLKGCHSEKTMGLFLVVPERRQEPIDESFTKTIKS